MIATATKATSQFSEINRVCNPYHGRQVGEVAVTGSGQITRIVQLAAAAAAEFRHTTPGDRRALLIALAEEVEKDQDNLATLICNEMGKTIREAGNEVRRARNTLLLSGDAATFLDGQVLDCGIIPGNENRQATCTYNPVGVVGAITPFNYPLNLLCHKLGPAIAAGNAVVAKPSPKAPLAAARLCELSKRAGFPRNLFLTVHGGAEQAVALASSPINLLSFTGGPQAGLALKRASGLIRPLMELGGNDPLLVLPDGDLQAAVKTTVSQRFEIAGQSCAAIKKLYLHEEIKSAFIDELLPVVQAMNVGDPADPATDMGPVVDVPAAKEVCRRVERACKAGARLLLGGNREGALVETTVVDNVALDSDLLVQETFGPVISIRSFTDLSGAIEEINDCPYGLQAGIYSNDHALIRQFARDIQVGGVMVNEGPDFRAEHVPFGGIKLSGLGREGVRVTAREMSEIKVVID